MRADLSLQQAPPFSVPARFLVSAPFFGLMAALVLLWFGPNTINHRWTPELLTVTHLLTLGFLTMSMIGAMMQLMPVLMGTAIPGPILFSRIIHSLLFLGIVSLALAWLLQIKPLFIISSILLALCFTAFIGVMTQCLLRSKSTQITRNIMLLALLTLCITVCLGLYLTIGYSGHTSLARQLTNLHLSWGLLGWALLLLMAVAYQVIPMFQITNDYPALHQRWMGKIIFTSLTGLSLTYLWPQTEPLKIVTEILLATCLLIFAVVTLNLLQKRRRQLPDLTMQFWQVAMVSLVLIVLCWAIPTLMDWNVPVLLLGVLMVNGFAMTSINGMMYKIIPFIIWLHLSTYNKKLRDKGTRAAQVKVPHMRKVIPESAGFWQFGFHLSSLILMALATTSPQWFYYPAAIIFGFSQAFLLFNLLKAVVFYNKKITELSAVIQIEN